MRIHCLACGCMLKLKPPGGDRERRIQCSDCLTLLEVKVEHGNIISVRFI